ncbi:hypothetical protein ES332_D05G428300v1 [Gossypium tomentosum]|uniref:Uncharacterized protein n=1 Tax=Gossypium tomentosum TaxID=34277 RepID=A0A5D2L6F4_GOSTO|nr:hypothetical protein ES332_D05G428300v1 [Gossypium tomentosum]
MKTRGSTCLFNKKFQRNKKRKKISATPFSWPNGPPPAPPRTVVRGTERSPLYPVLDPHLRSTLLTPKSQKMRGFSYPFQSDSNAKNSLRQRAFETDDRGKWAATEEVMGWGSLQMASALGVRKARVSD